MGFGKSRLVLRAGSLNAMLKQRDHSIWRCGNRSLKWKARWRVSTQWDTFGWPTEGSLCACKLMFCASSKFEDRARFVLSMACLLCALASTCFAAEPPALPVEAAHDMEADAMWSSHIEPILSKNCFRCHGGEKQKGGLDLRRRLDLVGGTDGSAVIPSQPNSSPLFQRIQPDSDEHMPADKGTSFSAEEIALRQAMDSRRFPSRAIRPPVRAKSIGRSGAISDGFGEHVPNGRPRKA